MLLPKRIILIRHIIIKTKTIAIITVPTTKVTNLDITIFLDLNLEI